MTTRDRLLTKTTETQNGCWIWIGSKNQKGYGRFFEHGKNRHAHRVSWEQHCGPIPKNMHVLHRCDNPPCVNPSHLFLGTNRDNALDSLHKGRHVPSPGSRNGRSKLTWPLVRVLRSLYITEGYAKKEMGVLVGMSDTQIGKIINGTSWKEAKHVTA